MLFTIGTKGMEIIMDDFIVGPQCEEIEEEFERGKRSLLELLDDAAQLDKDWVEKNSILERN